MYTKKVIINAYKKTGKKIEQIIGILLTIGMYNYVCKSSENVLDVRCSLFNFINSVNAFQSIRNPFHFYSIKNAYVNVKFHFLELYFVAVFLYIFYTRQINGICFFFVDTFCCCYVHIRKKKNYAYDWLMLGDSLKHLTITLKNNNENNNSRSQHA